VSLPPDATLRNLVDAIANSTRNIFPIVDDKKNFYGIIFLDDVRKIIFEPEQYDKISVKELSFTPEVNIRLNELIADVAEKFKQTDKYNMVVLDENNKYYGFISRANLFSSYRQIVEEISED
jgi:CIC family chloride channel protein